MKGLILGLGLVVLFASMVSAETYTGKAEKVEIGTSKLKRGSNKETVMGVRFEVVIKNEQGEEVARIPQRVSLTAMSPDEAIQAIKDNVAEKTMDRYAHEQAKEVLKKKVEIENYQASCNTFIENKNRRPVKPQLLPEPVRVTIVE